MIRHFAASLSLFLTLVVAAQQTPPSKPAPSRAAAKPTGVELGSEPVKIEALGLTVYLPEDASYSSEMVGGTSITNITPRGGNPSNPLWAISVKSSVTSDATLTLKEAADSAMTQLLDTASKNIIQVGRDDAQKLKTRAQNTDDAAINTKDIAAAPTNSSTGASLISREPAEGSTLTVAGPGQPIDIDRFYVQFPNTIAKNAQPVVRGVTICKIAPTQFVVFELYTTLPVFESAKKLYETIIASSVFEDTKNAADQRAMLVSTGVHFFEKVTEDDLVSLVDKNFDRWERIYKPSPTGKQIDDQEIGYRRVRTQYGSRNLVDKGRGRGVAAMDQGLIVQLDARFLSGEQIVDSQSVFFMTPDRREETWSTQMTVRNGDRRTKHVETGARTDKTMSVRVESPGEAPRSILPQIAGDGYISRVEGFLLPQLLVKKKIPAAYGFYGYQSQAATIQFRRDILSQPKKEGEHWKLVTRLAEGQPEQTSLLDDNGNFIRTLLPEGLVSEPIELAKLLELWKGKGLPVN